MLGTSIWKQLSSEMDGKFHKLWRFFFPHNYAKYMAIFFSFKEYFQVEVLSWMSKVNTNSDGPISDVLDEKNPLGGQWDQCIDFEVCGHLELVNNS